MTEQRSLSSALASLTKEISKFGTVGLAGLVVDLGIFNLLRFVGENGEGILYDKPLTAKALSVLVATLVTFTGNLLWTYRHQRTAERKVAGQYVLFFALNGIGMAIALGCLWISHYALGLTSALADNISANVIGLGLGTLFRFWSYRRFVFNR